MSCIVSVLSILGLFYKQPYNLLSKSLNNCVFFSEFLNNCNPKWVELRSWNFGRLSNSKILEIFEDNAGKACNQHGYLI